MNDVSNKVTIHVNMHEYFQRFPTIIIVTVDFFDKLSRVGTCFSQKIQVYQKVSI